MIKTPFQRKLEASLITEELHRARGLKEGQRITYADKEYTISSFHSDDPDMPLQVVLKDAEGKIKIVSVDDLIKW